VVGRHGLSGEPAFKLVLGLDASESAGHGSKLLSLPFLTGVLRDLWEQAIRGLLDPLSRAQAP
jgi:hypothetical protein